MREREASLFDSFPGDHSSDGQGPELDKFRDELKQGLDELGEMIAAALSHRGAFSF